MARFLVGVGIVALLILIWVLAVSVGTQLADGLRQVIP